MQNGISNISSASQYYYSGGIKKHEIRNKIPVFYRSFLPIFPFVNIPSRKLKKRKKKMIASVYYENSMKEIKGFFSIQLPDDKSPEEVRQYLDVFRDAAMKNVNSSAIAPAAIEVGNKVPLLAAPPAESTFPKNSPPKTATEKQLATAQRICTEKGINPKDAAEQYGGVSRLKDLTSQQMWKFINDKTNQMKSLENSF